jgi:hypothetical protein
LSPTPEPESVVSCCQGKTARLLPLIDLTILGVLERTWRQGTMGRARAVMTPQRAASALAGTGGMEGREATCTPAFKATWNDADEPSSAREPVLAQRPRGRQASARRK